MDETDITALVRVALQSVLDPEVGESIVELGLVERIEVLDGQLVKVVLVPTSATCPMADVLVEEAEQAAARALPAGWTAEVWLDFTVPWSPLRMSPALQARFGWDDLSGRPSR